MSVRLCVYVCSSVCLCACVSVSACLAVCLYLHSMYVCACVCVCMCMYICACISVYVCRCVCVWTIWKDVKLLTMQGSAAWLWDRTQRSYHNHGILGLINPAYLPVQFPFCQFSAMGRGQPKNHHAVFQLHQDLPQSFVSNRFLTNVRFSQSDLLLTSSAGTVASSQDGERILLYWFSRLVIHFLLSDFTGLFVHVRCIPHQ